MTDIALQEQCQPDALILLARGIPGTSTSDFCVAPARLLTSYLISTIFQLKKFTLQRGVILSSTSLRPAQLIAGGISVRLGAPVGASFPFGDTADIVQLVQSCCWERTSDFGEEVAVVLVSGTPFELPTDKAKAKRMQETWISARGRQLKTLAESIASLPTASPLQQAPSQKASPLPPTPKTVPIPTPSPVATPLPPPPQRDVPKPPAKAAASSTPPVVAGDAGSAPPETYRCTSCLNDISVHSRTIHTLRCRGVQQPVASISTVPALQNNNISPANSRSSSSAPSTGSSEFDNTHADDDYECHFEDVSPAATSTPSTVPPTRLPTVAHTNVPAQSQPRVPQPQVRPQAQHLASPPRSEVTRQSSLPSVHQRQPQPMSLHDDVDVDYCRDDAALAARLHREAEQELEDESRRLAYQLAESSHVSGSRGAPTRAPPPQQTKYPPHVNPYQRKAPSSSSQQPQQRYGQAPPVSRTPVSTNRHSGGSHHAFLDRTSRQPTQQPTYASGRPPPQQAERTPPIYSSGRHLPQQPVRSSSGRPQRSTTSTNRHTTLSADERYARELQEREDEETARAISNMSEGGGGASQAERRAAEERRVQEELDEAYALRLMQEDNY